MDQERIIEQIEDYLLNRMSASDRQAFERAVSEDANLAQLLEAHRLTLQVLDFAGNKGMREEVAALHAEEMAQRQSGKTPAKERSINWWRYAAILIPLVMVTFYFLQRAPLEERLFAEHFEAYDLSFANRGDTQQILAQAALNYQEESYVSALGYFQQLDAEAVDGKVELAQGISHLAIGETAAAMSFFQTLIDRPDPVFVDHARWYMALAHLQNRDRAQARPFLQDLANRTDAFRHQEAQAILDRL